VLESKIYRGIHEPSYLKWNKEELAIRDSLAAMNLFRIKQQLPMVLSVMRHHEDGSLKLKHVRGMCRAIENFHFIFTAVSSQRSSGGISFMYASSARNLYEAGTDSKKIGVLHALKQKLSDRLPPFGESAARFEELKFSSLYTKQKSIVRYILHKMYEHNAKGAALDLEKMTIEHIAPENPPQASGLTEEDVASIGNLILVTHELNNKLANKNFDQKKAILKQSGIWVDDMLLNAKRWGRDVIEERAIKMAQQAYDEVWTI
jgi:hypothetical protein